MSNENRYGLRSPREKISSRPASPAYGLSRGIPYLSSPLGFRSGLIRSIFPKQAPLVLCVLERVSASTAVTGSDVEKVVGAPLELAAVVVGEAAVLDVEKLAAR